MADVPFSEVVLAHGRQVAEATADAAASWREWADRLDELTRLMPSHYTPRVHDEAGDIGEVELAGVDRDEMRAELYHLVALADGYAAGLRRAAGLVTVRSEELSVVFALDEAEDRMAADSARGGESDV